MSTNVMYTLLRGHSSGRTAKRWSSYKGMSIPSANMTFQKDFKQTLQLSTPYKRKRRDMDLPCLFWSPCPIGQVSAIPIFKRYFETLNVTCPF